SVPDFSGQPAQRRQRLIPVLKLPGVRPILLVTLIFVLAHNILYTYIFPFLERANMAGSISGILLTFGLTSLLGIGIVGARV
ncbi:MFS transporter, partial [Bacillus sp. PsM16]|nr:MFS transporter [Bacillus sp. PsM16]